MSDPINLLNKRGSTKNYDAPDSSNSVGWTQPQHLRLADDNDPLPLKCGINFAPIDVEYETYGRLNEERSNAILILHALSGDAHVAGWDSKADEYKRPWRKTRPGWWDNMVGPGKAFDTNKYFIICSNVLGSCYGTTGPSSVDPATGKPYGLRFPVVTVGDWVRLQCRLIEHLGIEKLLAVAGGSLGGQQALEWTLAYPERVGSAIILASSTHLSDLGLAFNAVARHAILNDRNFKDGNYYGDEVPDKGLSIARMLGHITYLSEESMEKKFTRKYIRGDKPKFHLGIDFEVEGYLHYQGQAFVERFDANSYLYITKAMDYYDAASWGNGDIDSACKRTKSRFLLVSFSSDWLYTPQQTRELALSLYRAKKPVSYINIQSSYGHDAFLLEGEKLKELITSFLDGGIVKDEDTA